MNHPISPVLDTLIAEIDQQIKSCPHPYGADGDNPFFPGVLDLSKRRGQQYIRFFLNRMEFALPLASALQIGYTPDLTPLPNLPRWVLGICNIRGEIVSVVDLKDILRMDHQGGGVSSNLIILHNKKITTGIMVDKIAGILSDGDQNNMIQKQNVMEEKLSGYVQSVFVCGTQIIYLLDTDKLLSSIQIGDGPKTKMETAFCAPETSS